MEEDMSGTAEITTRRRKRAPAVTGYKGVVLQHNGRWGAQIYTDHRRVWLSTFNSEAEAAAAYDAASVRLRPSDSHRNFPRGADAARGELDFQSHLSTDALLAAIRDGSYRPRLAEFLRGPTAPDPPPSGPGPGPMRQLFRKELTPSDVGKLNRLVIPKKHAVRHFAEAGAGAVLVFRDSAMRAWKFRYCYWRSSQSYVLTRGWNRFVRENRLRQNDTVAFYSCERAPGGTFLVIDAVRAGTDGQEQEQEQVLVDENKEANDGHDNSMPVGIRLFGVQINA